MPKSSTSKRSSKQYKKIPNLKAPKKPGHGMTLVARKSNRYKAVKEFVRRSGDIGPQNPHVVKQPGWGKMIKSMKGRK